LAGVQAPSGLNPGRPAPTSYAAKDAGAVNDADRVAVLAMF